MEYFREIETLGWNAGTVSAVLAVVFVIIQAWGYTKQAKTLKDSEKVRDLSAFWMWGFFGAFIASFIYGIWSRGGALILNGMLGLFQLPIVIAVTKHKQLRLYEKIWIGVLAVGIVGMLVLPQKDWLFFFFVVSTVPSIAAQPIEIWVNKSARDVDIRMLITSTIPVAVWLVYGYWYGDWALQVVTPISLALFLITIGLWVRWHKVSRAPT